MRTWHPLVQFPGVGEARREALMQVAVLPAAPLEFLAARVGQSLEVLYDHQSDAAHASLFMGANELTPQVLGSPVDDLETEQLSGAIGIDTWGCPVYGEDIGLKQTCIALPRRPLR